MKKKYIIILMVLILLPLCVLGGIKLYRAIDDKYAAIDYAVKGSGYSVKSVNTYEGHLVYAIQGKGDYLGIKHRYEEYLISHPDSFLNKACPIEIVFRNGVTQGGALVIMNFVPRKRLYSELLTTPDSSGVHKYFDVAYVEDYEFAFAINLFDGSEYPNDITSLVLFENFDLYDTIAYTFPNIKQLLIDSAGISDKEFVSENIKRVLPDCELVEMSGFYCLYEPK